MKKGVGSVLLLVFIFLLFVGNFVYAEDTQNPINPVDVNQKVSVAQEKISSFLEKDFSVPENLQLPAKIFFGLKDEYKLYFEQLVVMFALWIVVLILIYSILEFVPFFGKGWKSLVGSFIITCLVANSGGLYQSSLHFFELGNEFYALKSLGFFKIILFLILLVVIVFLFVKAKKHIKNSSH